MATLPPGPKLPAILQLLHWIRRPIPFMEECARRYGDCFTIRLLVAPTTVFFSDPDAVKEIFTGNTEQLRAGEANVVLKPLLGQHSLLLLDGARHLRERRLLMPPFCCIGIVCDFWLARWAPFPHPPTDAGDHARRHPADRLRARRRR